MPNNNDPPERRHPAKGVLSVPENPTIIFLTVCTRKRRPWLNHPECHRALCDVWKGADAWLVGRYILMPDHIHLFAAPGTRDIAIEKWVGYWKSMTTRKLTELAEGWQKEGWHHRLRRGESYNEKWWYVRNNPVRKGLVQHCDDWPYQGEINALVWWGRW